jgi:hypothetical protein
MRKTTVGFVDGLSETDDTWGPLTISVNSGDSDLTDFFTVRDEEYTYFEWDGTAEEFPHERVRFVGEYADEAGMLSHVLDPGTELPLIAKLYDDSAGVPVSTEGWIERLAFGPGDVMYFGVKGGEGEITTVPVYLGKCKRWGDDDFANIRCVSWKKQLDEHEFEKWGEFDESEDVDPNIDVDDEPSLWIWEFELRGGYTLSIRWPGDNPEITS